MSDLAVTRSLVSNTNPTEAQWDTMRNDLLNFFNAASLDENNIADGGLTWSMLPSIVPDDITVKWTSSHATIQYISASDIFELKNTQGDVLFAHKETDDTITEFFSVRESDGALELFGGLSSNLSLGDQTVDTLWLLARYRKPRLVYSDDNIVTLEVNSIDASESLVLMRDRLCRIIDTTCSLAVDANGETNTDTGAAVSGRAAGIARTANRWYFIYAVRVQYGDDADGNSAILVAHTTSPTSGNIATLNTAFGTGEWVYMGVIRNGYNDGTSTNIIVPFIYDECGYLRFTQGTVDNEGIGVTMASQSGGVVNLEYDLVISNGAAATIPDVATRVIFTGHRESHGFELHYREIASSENHMIVTGCYHISELATLVPCVWMEVPLLSGYRVVVVMGNVATDKRICLAGLLDHYV